MGFITYIKLSPFLFLRHEMNSADRKCWLLLNDKLNYIYCVVTSLRFSSLDVLSYRDSGHTLFRKLKYPLVIFLADYAVRNYSLQIGVEISGL
jgi:hypothetical protein